MSNRLKAAKAKNPAHIYNEKRRIILSGMMNDPAKARKWLDGYLPAQDELDVLYTNKNAGDLDGSVKNAGVAVRCVRR